MKLNASANELDRPDLTGVALAIATHPSLSPQQNRR
jgi:hypothetical protein